jgi:disulfide bond formation protein DsbB
MTSLAKAKLLALLVPAGLLFGAYGFQYLWDNLSPCEMCWWQRYAHFAALPFAIGALLGGRLPDRGRSLVWLAALAVLVSGAIGFYHAGVELDIFQGFTQCSGNGARSIEEMMADLTVVPCDVVQWKWLGISMAGWNAILSGLGALVILWLSLKRPRTPA